MRTEASLRSNPSYSKNTVHQQDTPGAAMRLSNSHVVVPCQFSTCYVIEEEPSSDIEVDDNGNEQHNEVGTSCDSELFIEVNENMHDVESNVDDNAINNKNVNFTNLPSNLLNLIESEESDNCDDNEVITSLWPSSGKLSSNLCRLSDRVTRTISSERQSNEISINVLQERHDSMNRNQTEVKSGHLILIVSDRNNTVFFPKSDFSSRITSRTLSQSRLPVNVKIHGNGFEKYAIISGTRRHQAMPSSCLKLKHSYVTQSASNPSRFTVTIDSAEERSFTLEASNPEMAKEWMRAFSTHCSNNQNSAFHQSRHNSLQTSTENIIQQSQHLLPETKLSPVLNFSYLSHMPVLSESLDETDEE